MEIIGVGVLWDSWVEYLVGVSIVGGCYFYLKVESIRSLVKRVGESAFVQGGLYLKYLKMSSTFT